MANDIIGIVVTDNSDNVQINATPNLVSINVSNTSGNIIGSNYYLSSSYGALPIVGDTTTLYVTNDTSLMYRWNGSSYTQVNSVTSWGTIAGTLSSQTDLQSALNAKAPLASPTFTGTVSGITKSMVGLGNVDNTTDLLKPISTATQTALNLKYDASNPSGYISGVTSGQITTALGYTPENSANKGIANGYASLDGGGLVPSTQLPSYVDDVLEYTNLASFPVTGTTGKIYVDLATNKIYRWSGSTYIEVSPTVGTIWGGISGTLANQTDLQNVLNAKQATLSGTGFVKSTAGTISYDTNTYLTTSSATTTYVPYTGASGNVNLGTNNISANNFLNAFSNITASGTQVVLTVASAPEIVVNGSGGQTIKLPDATTLSNGASFLFNNNQSSGAITVNNNSNTLVVSVPSGGYCEVILIDNTTAAGSWDRHFEAPANVSWSTNTFDYAGSITSATWNGNVVQPNRGGTGQSTYTDGQLLIGNTSGNTLSKSTLTAGTGITITNGNGSISIANSGGTVTNVSALTLATTGTDVSSTVATGTTTPVITLNIPTASASNRGALSSADWTTFNNKANSLSGTANKIAKFTSTTAIGDSSITDTGSLVTIASPLTLSGSVTGVGNISNYSVTASSGTATSKRISSTLVASANGDTLVGLDINPTFTNGSFTGVSKIGLRTPEFIFYTDSGNNNYIQSRGISTNFIGSATSSLSAIYGGPSYLNGAGIVVTGSTNSTVGNGQIGFYSGGFNRTFAQFSSGNWLIQNGGTFTDAGYRLDVNGTTRFIGTTASDTAPLGSELAAVTGTGTSWTLAGTNLNVGGYSHTTGDVTPLTTSLAAVSGTYYQITYTITSRTTGSITIAYGGTSTAGITATGNTGPKASSTAVLTITPTTDFNGTVVLSIKSIGTSSASSTFANSSGATGIEFRASSLAGNIFIGLNAGIKNTTGGNNTFFGYTAGNTNTTGSENTFIGLQAGFNNIIANGNTYIGQNAGFANTIGDNNSFIGNNTGISNTTGNFHTFIGSSSGKANTTGYQNTFIGHQSAFSNTTGFNSVYIGQNAGQLNTTGNENTFVGRSAGVNNTTGSGNVSIGLSSGRYISDGSTSNAITDNSIYIGYNTKALASSQTNQIVIGNSSTGLGSNTTVLGNSSTATTAIYGNLLLGSTTDAGYKLDVTGTARIQGALTLGPVTIAEDVLYGLTIGRYSAGIPIAYLKASASSTGGFRLTVNASDVMIVNSTNTVSFDTPSLSIGTNSPNASAILLVESTTKGFLPPRMTTTQKNAISSPATGLVVFDTTLGKLCVYSSTWQTITSV